MTPAWRMTEAEAYRTIRAVLREKWPVADHRDVRDLALAVKSLTGLAPLRIASALKVIEATRRGVDAGHWPGAADIRAAREILLSALEFTMDHTRAEGSSIAGYMLRLLAEGVAPAEGCAMGLAEEYNQ
jgi:hypothetical protein